MTVLVTMYGVQELHFYKHSMELHSTELHSMELFLMKFHLISCCLSVGIKLNTNIIPF